MLEEIKDSLLADRGELQTEIIKLKQIIDCKNETISDLKELLVELFTAKINTLS